MLFLVVISSYCFYEPIVVFVELFFRWHVCTVTFIIFINIVFFHCCLYVIFLFLFNQQIGIYNPVPKDTVCKFNLMDSEVSFLGIALTVFNERNCQLWTMCMEVYLEALDKWEGVEECYDPCTYEQFCHGTNKSAKVKEDKESKVKGLLV